MTRGRKPKTVLFDSEWEQIFENSQGFYFQYIIIQLGRKNKKLSEKRAIDLLEIIKQEKDKFIAEKKLRKEKTLPTIGVSEFPFKIPNNWIWCRLGEIITMIYGKGLTKAQTIPNAEFPVFGSNGIVGYYNEYLTDKKSIIIGRKGSSGALNISEKPSWTTDVAYYVEESKNIDFSFIYFLLKSLNLETMGKGIKPGLNRNEAYNLAVTLPPLNEQKIIAGFLQDFGKSAIDDNREYFDSEIEDKIVSFHQAQIYNNQISTELEHQLELVSQLRQAFLREAMQGKLVPQDTQDEPAEVLLEKIKAKKEKLIAEKKIKKQKPLPEIKPEEIPFEIPNNWTWCKLGEIITMIYGSGLTKAETIPNAEFPVFGSNGVVGYYNEFLTEKRAIIIGRKGSSGALNISEIPSWTTDVAYYVEETDLIDFSFLYSLLRNLKLDKLGKGIKPGLNRTEAYNLVIALPPLAEQKRIVEKLEKLMAFCDELEANIQESKTNAENLLQVALKEALEPNKTQAAISLKVN